MPSPEQKPDADPKKLEEMKNGWDGFWNNIPAKDRDAVHAAMSGSSIEEKGNPVHVNVAGKISPEAMDIYGADPRSTASAEKVLAAAPIPEPTQVEASPATQRKTTENDPVYIGLQQQIAELSRKVEELSKSQHTNASAAQPETRTPKHTPSAPLYDMSGKATGVFGEPKPISFAPATESRPAQPASAPVISTTFAPQTSVYTANTTLGKIPDTTPAAPDVTSSSDESPFALLSLAGETKNPAPAVAAPQAPVAPAPESTLAPIDGGGLEWYRQNPQLLKNKEILTKFNQELKVVDVTNDTPAIVLYTLKDGGILPPTPLPINEFIDNVKKGVFTLREVEIKSIAQPIESAAAIPSAPATPLAQEGKLEPLILTKDMIVPADTNAAESVEASKDNRPESEKSPVTPMAVAESQDLSKKYMGRIDSDRIETGNEMRAAGLLGSTKGSGFRRSAWPRSARANVPQPTPETAAPEATVTTTSYVTENRPIEDRLAKVAAKYTPEQQINLGLAQPVPETPRSEAYLGETIQPGGDPTEARLANAWEAPFAKADASSKELEARKGKLGSLMGRWGVLRKLSFAVSFISGMTLYSADIGKEPAMSHIQTGGAIENAIKLNQNDAATLIERDLPNIVARAPSASEQLATPITNGNEAKPDVLAQIHSDIQNGMNGNENSTAATASFALPQTITITPTHLVWGNAFDLAKQITKDGAEQIYLGDFISKEIERHYVGQNMANLPSGQLDVQFLNSPEETGKILAEIEKFKKLPDAEKASLIKKYYSSGSFTQPLQ